ncbi:rhamnogalacturonan acetylesterase [Streptomyces sp. NPDC059894]|uniref:rhamnogalacturonan acetylesterase n=1 Tax=unclassified Streptomyces TaxID=2593676 RepID=UPI003665FFE8
MPRVLLAGDSTVAVCPAHETPMSGWGPHLGAPLNARLQAAFSSGDRTVATVTVLNTAKGGATLRSHREEGLWAALLHELRAGDVVLLQFGHNDQKDPGLPAREGYTRYLEKAVDEVLAGHAHPVLCTPVSRRRFADGMLQSTHGDYPQAVRDLAHRRGLPLIDLTRSTAELYGRLGEEASRALFTHFAAGEHPLYPDGCADDTHFSFTGAVAVADQVAQALVALWAERSWATVASAPGGTSPRATAGRGTPRSKS